MEREEKLKILRKKDQAAQLERVSFTRSFLLYLQTGHMLIMKQRKEEARIAQERKEKKWQKEHAYDELFSNQDDDEEANNQNRGEDWEDDFMQIWRSHVQLDQKYEKKKKLHIFPFTYTPSLMNLLR